jgi:hypothetical protein
VNGRREDPGPVLHLGDETVDLRWNTKNSKAYPRTDVVGVHAEGTYIKNGGNLYVKGYVKDRV